MVFELEIETWHVLLIWPSVGQMCLPLFLKTCSTQDLQNPLAVSTLPTLPIQGSPFLSCLIPVKHFPVASWAATDFLGVFFFLPSLKFAFLPPLCSSWGDCTASSVASWLYLFSPGLTQQARKMLPAGNVQLLAEVFHMAQHEIVKSRLSRNTFSLKYR